MESKKLSINQNSETDGRKITVQIETDKGEVLYSGKYAMVARLSNQRLIACPVKVPEFDEAGYLLNMVNELRDAYGKITKDGKLGDIDISALVEFNNILHTLTIVKGGEVQISPMVVTDYDRAEYIIRWSDMVSIESTKEDSAVYRGDFSVVVEGEDGRLQAYAHEGLGLKRHVLMASVVGEVLRNYRKITGVSSGKAIEIKGALIRKGLIYRPMIYGRNEVKFELIYGDYAGLIEGAELVLFLRPSC